jgi:hypothetical protein
LQRDLSKEFNLSMLSPEDQQKVMVDIGDIIFQRIILRILDELSEEDQVEFDRLLGDSANDDKVYEFLKARMDFDTIVEEEIANFKKTSAEFLESLGNEESK